MTRQERARTRQKVAELAGVSPTTVSLVLTGKASQARLSEATQQRVLAAARDLHYFPNAAARALVERRYRTIGIILSYQRGQLHLPIIEELVITAIEHAGRQGYWVIVLPPIPEERGGRDAGVGPPSIPVDGVIALGDLALRWARTMFEDSGIPVMCIYDPEADVDTTALAIVTTDDALGGRLIGRHLLERGHKRVGLLVVADQEPPACAVRFAGFAHEVGTAFPLEHVLIPNWSAEAGYSAMRELLSRNERVTAVFAANDLIAAGAMRAAHEMGLSIPRDIAMVGFGDMRLSEYLEPPLTTVRGPIRMLVTQAVDRLIGWLHGENIVGSRVVLPTELIVRAST